MGNIRTYQHQLKVVDLFDASADHTPDATGIFDKVQLIFFMIVHREIKLGFKPRIDGKAIGLR
jgi:hypothetical protein